MIHQVLILALVGLTLGGQHHGDGHDDNCVDISRYSELKHNISIQEICTYKVEKLCLTKAEEVCIPVPRIMCEHVTHTDCQHKVKTIANQRSDKTEERNFISKKCKEEGVAFLEEVSKVPGCKTVTKQHCDSNWVINELGEKVWDNNDNCKDVSYEDCTLVDKVITVEVPKLKCEDSDVLPYHFPVFKSMDVSAHEWTCAPTADNVCTQTEEKECINMEWEECTETVKETCIPITFNIPYQTYDHFLRCNIDDNLPMHQEEVSIPNEEKYKSLCECLTSSNSCSMCEVDCGSECRDLTGDGQKCFSKLACQSDLLFEVNY